MTRKKQTVVFLLLTALFLGVASGAVFVVETVHEYNGACSKLEGFPGMLQQAGLLQSGTCKGKPGGAVCDAGSTCTSGANTGKCKNVGKPGGAITCACVANPSK